VVVTLVHHVVDCDVEIRMQGILPAWIRASKFEVQQNMRIGKGIAAIVTLYTDRDSQMNQ
jgi:hypothetical protein